MTFVAAVTVLQSMQWDKEMVYPNETNFSSTFLQYAETDK